MSYVRYNESFHRTGFRPYGQTDAFSASQLNGIGRTPFDPAKLHGAPFTERGGWALNGLPPMSYATAAQQLTPPWWSVFLPGGPGAYELYVLAQTPGEIAGATAADPTLNPTNAVVGKLTSDQVDQIKQQAAVSITQAAGGDASLAASEIAQTNADIDATVGSTATPVWIWAVLAAGLFLVVR